MSANTWHSTLKEQFIAEMIDGILCREVGHKIGALYYSLINIGSGVYKPFYITHTYGAFEKFVFFICCV